MSSPQAIVSDILTYSCVDGPGNRFVIFLQGCNFDCPTCHNPHTVNLCNDCGDCIPACPVDALSLVAGQLKFDPTSCDGCDACLRACPISANPMARTYSLDHIMGLIRKNALFIEGITVSGGEATTQLKFVMALFAAVKDDPDLCHLTCFVDTNGHLGPAGWNKLLPLTDGVMLDIKAFDDTRHHTLTGRGNGQVLRAARILHDAGKLHELRYLIIPGQTDQDSEVAQLCALLAELGDDVKVRLNAFQHHGVKGTAEDWPKASKETVDPIAERLRNSGVTHVTTPALYL